MQEVKVSIRGWIGYFRVAYEADADVLGRMDAAQVPNVHLEAVEEAQNEGCQLEKAGHPGRQGLPVGKFQTGLLTYRRQSCIKMFHYKQKTRSSGIL